jgi:hypothetical protein
LAKYIEEGNSTFTNLKKDISDVNKTRPIIECPAATPFFDGKKCNSCPNETYVNLKTFACVSPVFVANTDALYELDNIFEEGNYTLDNIAAAVKNISVPTISCGVSKPAYNGK